MKNESTIEKGNNHLFERQNYRRCSHLFGVNCFHFDNITNAFRNNETYLHAQSEFKTEEAQYAGA